MGPVCLTKLSLCSSQLSNKPGWNEYKYTRLDSSNSQMSECLGKEGVDPSCTLWELDKQQRLSVMYFFFLKGHRIVHRLDWECWTIVKRELDSGSETGHTVRHGVMGAVVFGTYDSDPVEDLDCLLLFSARSLSPCVTPFLSSSSLYLKTK